MILEIVAEAKRERHAGGMPQSVQQEDVAANARSYTGQYLKETLKKAPHVPAPEKPSKSKRSSRAKSRGAEADQPDLIAAK